MDPRTQTNLWDSRIVPAAALTVFFVVCSLLLRPYDNLPFVDDWTYAWSVEQLLKTGELRISDWSAHYPLAQILWGALFCLPFGFSFSALRISTVVLAWLGALALYATLRELGRPRTDSLIATFLLLANPVFFILTFSYMTDVPFVSLANIAFFFFILGIGRERESHLWLGSFFAICAFLTRQIAVAIPVAVIVYFCVISRRRRLAYLLPPMLCLLSLLFTHFLISRYFGITNVYTQKLKPLEFWFDVSPLRYLSLILGMMKHLGLVVCALSIPLFLFRKSQRLVWIIVITLISVEVVVALATGEIILPLEKEHTWALAELGATLPLLGGARRLMEGIILYPFLPSWLSYPLIFVSLFSAAVMISGAVEEAAERKRKAELLFFLYGLFQTGLIVLLWLFYDRYYLVLLPPVIVLLIGRGLPHRTWTTAGICILLLISLTGTWDNLQLTKATHKAFDGLRQQGIPIAEIDAGYPLNGWHLYVHPENLNPGETPERNVPRVTADFEKPYVIAAVTLPGYQVLRVIDWSPSFWIATSKIYVLKKNANRE